ncbi:MAG: hypothetical protein AUG74_23430 [Bacteroidetes bacterium 13_1_20CM_4_60_6]|nr:MAG: hypothetical protein AUG74_23430 [Bacteroidetes bacterium 13_1_20CM_4_60_6]
MPFSLRPVILPMQAPAMIRPVLLLSLWSAPAKVDAQQTAQSRQPRTQSSARAATISGVVVDELGQPVPGARVAIVGFRSAVANEAGRYRIGAAPAGLQRVRASFIGYVPSEQTITVPDDGSLELNLHLEKRALLLDQVVVTGVFDERTAITAAVAISKVQPTTAVVASVPSSTALLKQVPGVFVNSALGEVRNIVYSRGISASSADANVGYYYVAMQEDGLPLTTVNFSNFGPDYFYRADATVQSLEAVRGGSANITSANAPGGIFNYISRSGGDGFGGVVRTRAGVQGDGNLFHRYDASIGGRLAEHWTYSVGGFWRYDEGARNPGGFPLNKGGQIKANATRALGGGYVRLYGKYLNDRNGWFEFIPAANWEDPTFAPGWNNNGSVIPAGYSAHIRSLVTGELRGYDPSKLIHSHDHAGGVELSHGIPGGWTLNNNAKYSQKGQDWQSGSGIFPSTIDHPLIYTNLGSTGNNGTYTFTDARTGALIGTTTRTAGVATVTSADPANPLGRVFGDGGYRQLTHATEFMDRLSLAKSIGSMKFTVGGFFATAELRRLNWAPGYMITTYRSQPAPVSIAFTPTDSTTVYQLTDANGLARYSNGETNSNVSQRQLSAFFGHSWEVNNRASTATRSRCTTTGC